jgi:hypothetical protein
MNRRDFILSTIAASILPSMSSASFFLSRTVYFLDASFGHCGISFGCHDGPKTVQWLSSFLAQKDVVLSPDGRPGSSFFDFQDCIENQNLIRTWSGANELGHKIPASILGISGAALTDLDFQGIKICERIVRQMNTWSENVFVLDYPPIEDRDLPFLTGALGVDPNWWDNTYRYEYRKRMHNVGAKIIYPFFDWKPTNVILPNTSGYPDYHIDSESSRKAALRIVRALDPIIFEKIINKL